MNLSRKNKKILNKRYSKKLTTKPRKKPIKKTRKKITRKLRKKYNKKKHKIYGGTQPVVAGIVPEAAAAEENINIQLVEPLYNEFKEVNQDMAEMKNNIDNINNMLHKIPNKEEVMLALDNAMEKWNKIMDTNINNLLNNIIKSGLVTAPVELVHQASTETDKWYQNMLLTNISITDANKYVKNWSEESDVGDKSLSKLMIAKQHTQIALSACEKLNNNLVYLYNIVHSMIIQSTTGPASGHAVAIGVPINN